MRTCWKASHDVVSVVLTLGRYLSVSMSVSTHFRCRKNRLTVGGGTDVAPLIPNAGHGSKWWVWSMKLDNGSSKTTPIYIRVSAWVIMGTEMCIHTIPYHTIPYHTIPHTIPYHATPLHHITVHYVTLRYILHYVKLHYIALHYVAHIHACNYAFCMNRKCWPIIPCFKAWHKTFHPVTW